MHFKKYQLKLWEDNVSQVSVRPSVQGEVGTSHVSWLPTCRLLPRGPYPLGPPLDVPTPHPQLLLSPPFPSCHTHPHVPIPSGHTHQLLVTSGGDHWRPESDIYWLQLKLKNIWFQSRWYASYRTAILL